MAGRLERRGYDGYRRTDAAVFRRLLRGPAAVGQLGAVLGVTRQAARKIVDGLEQRDYVTTERDARDGRRVSVSLTPAGDRYARAVVEVLGDLNTELTQLIDPDHLGRGERSAAGGDRRR